mmetsp:Transcript_51868/g.75889  ORF Transcript_51868/g.75889 Transcript_51868/m.75889 type:complete len:87 (-) Transcript_51868:107-367(-)
MLLPLSCCLCINQEFGIGSKLCNEAFFVYALASQRKGPHLLSQQLKNFMKKKESRRDGVSFLHHVGEIVKSFALLDRSFPVQKHKI